MIRQRLGLKVIYLRELGNILDILFVVVVPELWSEEEVSEDLGSGLNMLASGLI